MRGHEHILAMRKAGTAPKIIFINDFQCDAARDWQNPGEKHGEVWPCDHATVSTEWDALSSLDLRFVVGLTVSISSHNEARARALFAKAKQFGAKAVAAGHHKQGAPVYMQDGWSDVWRKEASNG